MLQGILLLMRSRLIGRLPLILERDVGAAVVDAAMDHARRAPSSAAARAHEHLFRLRQLISSPALTSCLDLPWVLVFLVPIWLLHPWLGTIAVVGAVFLLLIAVAAEWLATDPTRRSIEAAGEARRHTDRALDMMPTVDAMGMRQAVIAHGQKANLRALIEGYRAHDRAGAMAALSKCIRQAVQLAILLTAVYLVLLDQVTVGIIFAASILAARALAPIDGLAGSWRQIVAAVTSLQQLDPLLQAAPRPPQTTAPARLAGALAVEAVTLLSRDAGRAVLRGVSFALEPGTALAVSGPSGAGKSALASVLIGATAATMGEVRIDGLALRHWDPAMLGRGVGYLPQDAELLPGSVAENIARFGAAAPEQVVEAARPAGAHEMILGLSEGYDTEVGTRTSRLSPGQQRRVALARALFGDPRLLVLDEPNAGLDRDGERHLVGTLKTLKAQGVTIVLVTHRIADRSLFDRVLILHAGVVSQLSPLDRREVAGTVPAPAQIARSQPTGLRRVEGG
jgi:PrtD family type I secretion system ABC transporter